MKKTVQPSKVFLGTHPNFNFKFTTLNAQIYALLNSRNEVRLSPQFRYKILYNSSNFTNNPSSILITSLTHNNLIA